MLVTAGTFDKTTGLAHVRATPWRVAILLVAVSALLVAAWPLGLAGDYMNHLARNYIEAQIWSDPALRQNYVLSLSVIPDLAMDMVVPWLSHLIGIYPAGAVMIWTALAVPPLAGLLVARSLYGRATWLSLLGFFGVFNQNVQWGFVDFVVSTGIALAGFAVWIRLSPGWRRSLAFVPFGLFLAFCHALGFLLFGYLVLLWELACFASGQRGRLTTFLRQMATKDLAAMLPGLAVLALATAGGEALPHIGVTQFDLASKIASMWSGTLFFESVLARAVAVVLIGGCWAGLRRGVLSMEPRMIWVCGGLLALIVVMPTSTAGIWGLHFRYPAVLIILVAASVSLKPGLDRRAVKFGAAGVCALLAAIHVNAAIQMARIDGHAGMLRPLLAGVQPGARVLPARGEETDLLLTLHADTMAVIERSAYVPGLFTNTSPVDVRAAMRPLHMPQSWPLTAEKLAAAASLDLPGTDNGFWSPYYYYGWPKHWDYVLYLRGRPDEALHSPFLCQQEETVNAVLYKVTDSDCGKDRGSTPKA